MFDFLIRTEGEGETVKGRRRGGDEFRNRTAISHYTAYAVFHSGNTVFTSLKMKKPLELFTN